MWQRDNPPGLHLGPNPLQTAEEITTGLHFLHHPKCRECWENVSLFIYLFILRFPDWLSKQLAASFYWLQTQLMKLICCAAGLWCHISNEGFQGFACSVQSCSRSDPAWMQSQAAWSLGGKWHITARKWPWCRLSVDGGRLKPHLENRAEVGGW